MTATNPFTTIKEALRSYIEAHWDSLPADNPAKVKEGNRWYLNLRKGARQAADLPAVEMRQVGGGDNKPFASSSSGLFTRSWELGIATDAITPEPDLDQAQWELVRVAAKAQGELLGLPNLVLKVAVDSSDQTSTDHEANRNTRKWTGTVVLTIQFQIPRSQIIPT